MKQRFAGAWAVADEAWPEVEAFIMRCSEPQAMDELEDYVNGRPEPHVDSDGVGHVFIQGPLVHKSTEFERALGATDYDLFAGELDAITARQSRGVMIHADSPGGMVSGIEKAVEAVQRAVFETTVMVHADGMCCSAMYWIAAAADGIMATETSAVGSIGAKFQWLNPAGFMERLGIKFEEVVNDGADLKGFRAGNPTEAQRDHIQNSANFLGENFQAFVESHRDVDPEVYRAGSYFGDQALSLGLVDDLGSAEGARRQLL